jgi:type II secretory pathway pseudopilin PulG
MLLPRYSRRAPAPHRQAERGYILLTLMLFTALLVIAAVAMAPELSFQIKRDREEELIHRGVQYSRAIKHYVKKFGRYPTRLEDLENTNQVRFLRRRYKDPITGKDFKLLHLGEVQMAFGAGIPGLAGVGPGAPGLAGGPGFAGAANPGSPFGGALVPGQTPGLNAAINTQQIAATIAQQQASLGQQPTNLNQTNLNQGDESSQSSTGGTTGGTNPAPGAPGGFGTPITGPLGNQPGSPGGNNQVFGGGPIVGVTSTSKEKSIRLFNRKDHYNQWQFIYDPSTDTGGLLATPNQPQLIPNATGAQPGVGGNPAAPGGFGSPGAGSPFGGPGSPSPQPSPNGGQPMQPNMPPDQ